MTCITIWQLSVCRQQTAEQPQEVRLAGRRYDFSSCARVFMQGYMLCKIGGGGGYMTNRENKWVLVKKERKGRGNK